MLKPLVMTALVLACGLTAAQSPAPAPTAAGTAEREARRAEWKARADARFAEADKDRDGTLDKVELGFFGEHGERLARHFDKVDANTDGELDREELRNAREGLLRGRLHKRGRMQFQRGLFLGMDDDADGEISRAELGNKLPRWAENFGTIDANADGKLSKEELHVFKRDARQAHQAERED